jgi:hypothetical protein
MMGGEIPILHDANEMYDIASNRWTCLEPMPVPRHGVAAVPLGGRVFTPAGGVIQGLDPTTHVDSFMPVPGDVDGDGLVTVADLVDVILAWGPCAGLCAADLNADGVVGVEDLVIVILNWS